jgi:hypothetical protein
MNDLELKNLLLETCAVRPGQEQRAWAALKNRLAPAPNRWWLFFPTRRSLAFTALALLLAPAIFDLGLSMRPQHHALVFADSEVPGIYATSFYSNSAQAQVVWLNGMDPASDKPTYLDPTTVVSPRPDKNLSPAKVPESL